AHAHPREHPRRDRPREGRHHEGWRDRGRRQSPKRGARGYRRGRPRAEGAPDRWRAGPRHRARGRAALAPHAVAGARAFAPRARELHAEVLAREGRAPDPTAITEALRNLSLPGRVGLCEGPPAVLIDGAHTAESFALLAECLPELALPSPRTVIFSIAADKNVEPILDLVRTIGDDFLWTRADPVRSLDPAELQARTGVGT